ncbi:MAG: hypothetical protein ABSH41_10235 [Syntrophobacteraceae bacterium]|jgi:hypothetical protein
MPALLVKFLLSLVVGVIVGTFLYSRKAPRTLTAIGSLFSAVMVLAGATWLSNSAPSSIQTRIVAPQTQAQVGQRALVEGEVSPILVHVYVLVHPLSSDRWWVQDLPLVQNDGHWQVKVYLGTENVGKGEEYEILAVATNESIVTRLLRGDYPAPGQQLKAIAPYFAKSNVIVVRRNQ